MKKILVVEDEKDALLFLKEHLERLNFEVETAMDGKEAIEKVKEFLPHLIILDIVLPQLDGLEVLKWVKENRPDICVILATGKKEVDDIKKGYSLEADYYITKPYVLEEIVKGINVMVSLRQDGAG